MLMRIFMRQAVWLLIVTVAAAGCSERYSEEHTIALTFLAAAADADSLGMAAHVAEDYPIEWAENVRAEDPALLFAIKETLQVRLGERRDEVSVVEFSFEHDGQEESIGFRFVQVDGTWKVSRVQLTDRI
jgi:hypothetical protein